MDRFEEGILFAAALLVRLHDIPSMAAELIRNAGLAGQDCSSMDEYEKEMLRIINNERGMALVGLGKARKRAGD